MDFGIGNLIQAAAPIVGAIAGGPVGAGIGAGIGKLGDSLVSSEAIKDQNAGEFALAQYQNAWNEQMYERQKEDAIEFWNKQNEYNTPKATMARLVEAGLNPKGTGLGQYANAGSINSPSAQPSASASYKSPLAAYTELGATLGGLEQMRLNLEKTAAETQVFKDKANLDFVKGLIESFRLTENMDKHAFWRFVNDVQVINGESRNFDDRTYLFGDDSAPVKDKKIKDSLLEEYGIKNQVARENMQLGAGTGDGGDITARLLMMLIRQIKRHPEGLFNE